MVLMFGVFEIQGRSSAVEARVSSQIALYSPGDAAKDHQCQRAGITPWFQPHVESRPSKDVFAKGAEWIENEESQHAIDAFWKSIERTGADVHAAVDPYQKLFAVIIAPDEIPVKYSRAIDELKKHISISIEVGCFSGAALENMQQSVSNWMISNGIRSPRSVGIDYLHSSITVTTSDESLSDRMQANPSMSQLPITVIVTEDVPVAYGVGVTGS